MTTFINTILQIKSMEETELQRFGLTRIEAKVYIALLRLGSTTAGPLIKKTELHRATVYDVLKRLMEKGLVNYIIKGKIKYFEAADPERFLEILREKRDEIEKQEKSMKILVKELFNIKSLSKKKHEARIYCGVEGIKTILGDVLKHKRYYSFSSRGWLGEVLGPYYYRYQKMKQKLNIKHKMLAHESFRISKYKSAVFGEIRYLPKEYTSPNTTTFIYDDKVAICVWVETPIGFLIESSELAKTYRNYFTILWKIAKK